MPAKKKTKKTHHVHSRRKVGALGPAQMDGLAMGAGAAVGAGAGWYIYTTQTTIADNLMGLIQAAIGFVGLLFLDMPLLKGVSIGLIGSAAIIEGESFGLLSGITNLPNSSNLRIAGPGNVRQLGGTANVHQLGAAPNRQFPMPAAVGRAGMTSSRYAGIYHR